MNPNYEKSLNIAAECNQEDIDKIRDLAVDMKNSSSNLNILADFIEYATSDDSKKYLNAFEMLNLNERSISRFLCLLLDVSRLKENIKDSFQYKFCVSFLNLISTENDEWAKDIEKIALNAKAECETDNVDILLSSTYGENKEFYCVIENKKKAKLSISDRTNEDGKWIQLEKYWTKYQNKNNAIVKFIYICADKNDAKEKIHYRLTDKGDIPTNIKEQLKIKDTKTGKNFEFEDYKDETILRLLQNFNYMLFEHKDIALILYNLLDYQDKSSDFQNVKDLIKIIHQYYNNNNTKKAVGKLIETINNGNDSLKGNVITYKDNINEILGKENKINGNAPIYFDKMDGNQEYIKTLAKEYIEYWELHYDVGYLRDNIRGYSKIIKGKYIHDVCMCIYEESDVFQNLDGKIQKLIIEMIKENLFFEIMSEINAKEIFENTQLKPADNIEHQRGWYEFCWNINGDSDKTLRAESYNDYDNLGKFTIGIWSEKLNRYTNEVKVNIFKKYSIDKQLKDQIKTSIKNTIEKNFINF